MDTIFMNSENSRTSEYHVLVLKLSKIFKISAPTWSDELELPDGSYSISDIQDYI